MKYNESDTVRVKDNLILGEDYGGYRFINPMVKHKGRQFIVITVFDNRFCYGLSDNSHCVYTDEMLDPITNWKKRLSQ